MAAPANLGFETAGSSAEEAASWTVNISSSQIQIANAGGTGTATELEGFEHDWSNTPLLLALDPLAITVEPPETFESGWGLYLFGLILAAEADETFESGWSNTPLLLALDPLAITVEPPETFESGWGAWSSTITSSTVEPPETFEAALPSNVYTVAIGSPGLFTAVAHGYVAGSHVVVSVSFGGTLAGGLVLNRSYVVAAAGLTADTFTLQDLSTAPVATSTVGSGVQTITADPAFAWATS